MLEPLIGYCIFSIEKGHGSFLTIELKCGNSTKSVGDVSLWIYLCDWSLQVSGELLVDASHVSDSTDFTFMLGRVFEGYEFSKVEDSFCLKFSDSTCIFITPDLSIYEVDDDMMMLSFTGGNTFGYSPSHGWKSD